MPELSKDIIGTKSPPFTIDVERGKVKEFCLAIGETNPVYLDPDAAKKEGFTDTPIPPTFQTSFGFWGNPDFFESLPKLGIDVERLLHMKEEYDYVKPIYPGDTITVSGEITDVKVGKAEIVTFKNTYTNQNGDVCIDAIQGIIMRPKES